VVGVLSLAVFMSSLDLFIVNLAFPYISRDYPGTSLSSLSWVLNAYTIVFAAVLVPAGRWADRIGRRRLFSGGLILFSFGSVLCGLAPGVAALIAARVIQAAGAGAMVPASLSLLLAAVPPPVRPKALGTWSALGALGAALGPVIGGALVQVDWRWVFWINVPVGVAAVFLAARVVPESKDPNVSGRPDILGAGLLAAAVEPERGVDDEGREPPRGRAGQRVDGSNIVALIAQLLLQVLADHQVVFEHNDLFNWHQLVSIGRSPCWKVFSSFKPRSFASVKSASGNQSRKVVPVRPSESASITPPLMPANSLACRRLNPPPLPGS
jgi:MFS family permease